MRRILVTGGAGFIGANFVRYWAHRHRLDRLVVLDALTYAGNPANLPARNANNAVRLVKGDICDLSFVQHVLQQERIDWVVHFAAESHVDRSIDGPDEFIRTNVVGTHTLLKAVRSAWMESSQYRSGVRFHHVSTDEVYGSLSEKAPAFTEETAYAPNSPYAASKAAADCLVRAYHHTFDLPVTTSNCSNNYGPYQFPEKLIPLMLLRALGGEPLPVYGSGDNVRDWLYVDDHCAAIEAILARGSVGRTYNVGGCNEWRNIDVVHFLCELLERRFAHDRALAKRFPRCPAASGQRVSTLLRFVADRRGHDRRYAIDAARIRQELGFEPAERFETGMEKTIDWYLDNESWWRNILSGAYRMPLEATGT